MPKGPKSQKHPAGAIGNAVKVMRSRAGPETEDAPVKSAAAILGSLGGKARAANLSKMNRSKIAQKAAKARWKPW
jgi:hypothetical protein